jgi:hypothetical protein
MKVEGAILVIAKRQVEGGKGTRDGKGGGEYDESICMRV